LSKFIKKITLYLLLPASHLSSSPAHLAPFSNSSRSNSPNLNGTAHHGINSAAQSGAGGGGGDGFRDVNISDMLMGFGSSNGGNSNSMPTFGGVGDGRTTTTAPAANTSNGRTASPANGKRYRVKARADEIVNIYSLRTVFHTAKLKEIERRAGSRVKSKYTF
jgi:hypothetical protein